MMREPISFIFSYVNPLMPDQSTSVDFCSMKVHEYKTDNYEHRTVIAEQELESVTSNKLKSFLSYEAVYHYLHMNKKDLTEIGYIDGLTNIRFDIVYSDGVILSGRIHYLYGEDPVLSAINIVNAAEK